MRDGAIDEGGEAEHEADELTVGREGAGDDAADFGDHLEDGCGDGVVVPGSPDLVLQRDARLAFGARGDGAHGDVGLAAGEGAGVGGGSGEAAGVVEHARPEGAGIGARAVATNIWRHLVYHNGRPFRRPTRAANRTRLRARAGPRILRDRAPFAITPGRQDRR